MCTIQAPPSLVERAPIDLVCVVDKSGSMQGEKLRLVKEACLFIVEELKEGDHFCLVTYDDNITVDFPLANMNKKNKQEAINCIKEVRDGGSTNLSDGLFTGIECANGSQSGNSVSSIWLFTDGQANKGIVNTDGIVKEMLKLLGSNTMKTVFTFGFGSDHKADMLTEIADKGNGMYYYIEGSSDIGPSFADCLGGVLSVYAQEISLVIEPANNCKIIKVLGVVKKKRQNEGKKNNNNAKKDDSDTSDGDNKKNDEIKEEIKTENKETNVETDIKEKNKERRYYY